MFSHLITSVMGLVTAQVEVSERGITAMITDSSERCYPCLHLFGQLFCNAIDNSDLGTFRFGEFASNKPRIFRHTQ